MKKFINIADLKATNNQTYRQQNEAKNHFFNIDQLVEIESGARLFIAKQTRDCDGTPLYSLTPEIDSGVYIRGYPEEGMKAVKNNLKSPHGK